MRILDVGCGSGALPNGTDIGPHDSVVRIDIDPASLLIAKGKHPDHFFIRSEAEALPFANSSFERVVSGVAVPYTDIPLAVSEFRRVLAPGGRLFLSLHPLTFTLKELRKAFPRPVPTFYRLYVIANGITFHIFGRVVRFPRRRFESFQTAHGIKFVLSRSGFGNVAVRRPNGRLLVEAISLDTLIPSKLPVRTRPSPVKEARNSPASRILSSLQYRFLNLIAPSLPETMAGRAYEGKSKLKTCCPGIETEIKDKVVLDFGCGPGLEVKELAKLGAKHAVGVDISRKWLEFGRRQAEQAGLGDKCEFVSSASRPVEIIISLDCFEHFSDPDAVLRNMFDALVPGGQAFIAFGPTWYHPLGGHLFSVFPWSHILLKEDALIRWRAQFKTDGANRFCEVEGGLNQMTIRRFEQIIERSPFVIEELETVPIRRLSLFHNRLTREFLTAIVRCRLRKPLRHAAAA